ncbi:MAG: hypothetical protein H6729_09300 [Deltaproteobacteria bacterium]|nr:hypothetical protein [Deltaproteobacteria bacterium]
MRLLSLSRWALCFGAISTSLLACADPVSDARDAGDTGDAGDAGHVGALGDADTLRDATGSAEADASVGGRDAAVPTDGGALKPCPPSDQQYVMLGSAQNPQTVTFGAGYTTERTVDLDGAYIASFGPDGCFQWLARIDADQPSFGRTDLVIDDDDGSITFGLAVNGGFTFHNADDDAEALSVTSSTVSASDIALKRGILLVQYDRDGTFRWAKRLGNAALEPNAKTYSVSGLHRVGDRLRLLGTAVGSTRDEDVEDDLVFGEGESGEQRLPVRRRAQFGFIASFDAHTGDFVPDSVILNVPSQPATQYGLRHNGTGIGTPADDGSFVVGMLFVGAAGDYMLGVNTADPLTVSVSQQFVGAFVRYTGASRRAWVRFVGAETSGVSIFASAILRDGTALFSGNAGDEADVDDGQGGTHLPVGANGFLVRYDVNGTLVWMRGLTRAFSSLVVGDENDDALFALGSGDGQLVFGVGDDDAETREIQGPYVARLRLSDGRLVWVRSLASTTATFRGLDFLDGALVLSARADGSFTIQPGEADEETITNASIWSGSLRFDRDGNYLGATPYIVHPGTRLNDGLNAGTLINRPR